VLQGLPEAPAHFLHLVLVHPSGEGQGEGRASDRLGDGEAALPVAEPLLVERLKVDGREVWTGGDAPGGQARHHAVPRDPRGQADDVNEPGHPRGGGSDEGDLDPFHLLQPLVIPSGHLLPFGQQLLDAGQLGQAQGGAHLIHPVVVAQAGVAQPPILGIPPLIAQGPEKGLPARPAGDDHPPLAGGHLLVGVEGEDRGVPEGARLAAFVFGPDGLAGVLDHRQTVGPSDFQQRVHVGGLAEDVNRQEGFGRAEPEPAFPKRRGEPASGRAAALAQVMDGLGRLLRADVQGERVDIHKHRDRAFVEDDVGGGDEGERGGEDEIAFADAGGDDAEVKAGRAAGDADGERGPDIRGEAPLEFREARPEAEMRGAKHPAHRLHLSRSDVGRRHGDYLDHPFTPRVQFV
jgi:hypothetical protein